MAEKPSQEANSQSSKLDENKLQNLEEASRRQIKVNVSLLSLSETSISSRIYLGRTACYLFSIILNAFK